MKNLITFSLILIFSVTSTFAQSQPCDCKSDLDFLVEKMKSMPSYKKQIKGQKLVEFQNTYNELSSKMMSPVSVSECFRMLNQQLMVVTDFHAKVRANDSYLSEENYYDEDKQQAFLNSDTFIKHPRTTLELTNLENELKNKPKHSIEGIYNYGTQITSGIYKSDENTIVGVILSSAIKIWEPGQIQFIAKKNQFGKYDMFTYHNRSRQLLLVKNLTFENGRLWSYKKVGNTFNFETRINNKSNWDFKQINDDVQYVYFGEFSSFTTENRKAFKNFYEKHKNAFTAKHIIIDLRSNGGGNKKLSDPFIKLFRKSKAKVYVLTNCYTGSNAEQFTTKLKKIKEAIHLGQTTYGSLAYGINYGTSYDMPSGHFRVVPTDMNFHRFFNYEGHGITPDIKLDFDRDWIEQTLEIIESNS
ncbi:S41 family peptidase [Psychroserpens luteolus]|uniref:S41 family peptidase n=1 Tax=Psychroserpens luteolus TaxID=2855840 RepID=UPI001E3B98D6|nr:S41 family peptidase [Psychroserpens luteolus]MCD2258880.1 hypothetical protein [Psychroserpens luteolus]